MGNSTSSFCLEDRYSFSILSVSASLPTLAIVCPFSLSHPSVYERVSQVALAVKNLPAKAGDTRDVGSIPGLRRSPGGGNGNPLQYACLENLMDGGPWWATVHGVTKSWTQLKQLSTVYMKEYFIMVLISFPND